MYRVKYSNLTVTVTVGTLSHPPFKIREDNIRLQSHHKFTIQQKQYYINPMIKFLLHVMNVVNVAY